MGLFKNEEFVKIREKNKALEIENSKLVDELEKLKTQVADYQAKEQSISSAILFAVDRSNQLEESRKKLYELDIQRSRLLYLRMEQVLNELYNRYPDLKKDIKLTNMAEKFKQAVYSNFDNGEPVIPKEEPIKEDPIRKLLGNIINYIGNDTNTKTIKRGKNINGFNLTPQQALASTKSSSGFDINEALHPTESLDEIMKAFDLGNKKAT